MAKKKSSRVHSWRIVAKEDGDIYIWEDSKCRIWSRKYTQIEDYLAKWIKPQDIITFVGFRKEDVEVTGERFLKEYHA